MREGPKSPLLALKMKKGATSQGLWTEKSLEAGKGTETGSSLEPPEGMPPSLYLDFSPPRPTLDF